jgi:hypothetical protein
MTAEWKHERGWAAGTRHLCLTWGGFFPPPTHQLGSSGRTDSNPPVAPGLREPRDSQGQRWRPRRTKRPANRQRNAMLENHGDDLMETAPVLWKEIRCR